MYLHIGKDTMINIKNMVGIFDLDTTTVSKKTRDFLAKAEKDGKVINTSTELPKSFAVMAKPNNTIYVNQLSTTTLKGRIEALPTKKYKINKNKIKSIYFYLETKQSGEGKGARWQKIK